MAETQQYRAHCPTTGQPVLATLTRDHPDAVCEIVLIPDPACPLPVKDETRAFCEGYSGTCFSLVSALTILRALLWRSSRSDADPSP